MTGVEGYQRSHSRFRVAAWQHARGKFDGSGSVGMLIGWRVLLFPLHEGSACQLFLILVLPRSGVLIFRD